MLNIQGKIHPVVEHIVAACIDTTLAKATVKGQVFTLFIGHAFGRIPH